MSRVQGIIDCAETQCRNSGARLIDKRIAILSGLLGSKEALSAYKLINQCELELGEKLPAITVYRILGFLEDEQLVHKLKLATTLKCNINNVGFKLVSPQLEITRFVQ